MNDAFKAHILDYDFDTDDDEYTSEDDDDLEKKEDWKDLEEAYDKKEDADVAVFSALVEDMPIESILHLLQGHAKGENEHYEKQQQEEEEVKMPETPQERPEKIFRWAEEEEEDDLISTVKCVYHEIEPIKGMPELWFTSYELNDIRHDLIRQIRFFVMHHKERIRTIDRIITAEDPEPVMEEHMKSLTKHSISRGLEGHMSKLIPQTRKNHIKGVLQVQSDCGVRQQSYDEAIEAIREQSLVQGQAMGMFAQRMAKCDEIEALTASMSHWEASY